MRSGIGNSASDPIFTTSVGANGSQNPAGSTSDPVYQRTIGTANMATGQVAVGTAATLVAASRAGRQKITLSQTNAVASVYYVGNAGVTAATGVYVASGGAITLDTSAAIYAISTTASTISYVELY